MSLLTELFRPRFPGFSLSYGCGHSQMPRSGWWVSNLTSPPWYPRMVSISVQSLIIALISVHLCKAAAGPLVSKLGFQVLFAVLSLASGNISLLLYHLSDRDLFQGLGICGLQG